GDCHSERGGDSGALPPPRAPRLARTPGSPRHQRPRTCRSSSALMLGRSVPLLELLGFDFGSVLGFEIREGIPRETFQAAIEGTDGVRGLERRQAYGAIPQDLDAKPGARGPPEMLAHGLGNDDLTLAGHTGGRLHECDLTS